MWRSRTIVRWGDWRSHDIECLHWSETTSGKIEAMPQGVLAIRALTVALSDSKMCCMIFFICCLTTSSVEMELLRKQYLLEHVLFLKDQPL